MTPFTHLGISKKKYSILQQLGQGKAHNQRDTCMGGLELLGFLALLIGVIGIIVLVKSRKNSDGQ